MEIRAHRLRQLNAKLLCDVYICMGITFLMLCCIRRGDNVGHSLIITRQFDPKGSNTSDHLVAFGTGSYKEIENFFFLYYNVKKQDTVLPGKTEINLY